jgi:hypothetical protein
VPVLCEGPLLKNSFLWNSTTFRQRPYMHVLNLKSED